MNLQSNHDLQKKLANERYREAFVASRIAQTLAIQLRVLRQRADLSQDELAKRLGTSQNAISRMENPTYGKASISTLRKIASFFRVGLIVRFAPISEIANWTRSLAAEAVNIPAFEDDAGFIRDQAVGQLASAAAAGFHVIGQFTVEKDLVQRRSSVTAAVPIGNSAKSEIADVSSASSGSGVSRIRPCTQGARDLILGYA